MADITSFQTPTTGSTPTNRLLRWPDVRDRVGICRSQAYKLIDAGRFPKPISIVEGGRSIAWIESDISSWVDQRIADSRSANQIGG